MFQEITEYMKKSRDERRAHLNLDDKCIEIGAHSKYFKGLLAHHLKTTIPYGIKVLLCHACHNGKCSNPNHLYWGTYTDNMIDHKESGKYKSFHDKILDKYGVDGLKVIKQKAHETKIKNGTYASKRLSQEDLDKYREAFEKSDIMNRGWLGRASSILGVSHTQVRRVAYKHFPELNFYKRN